MGLEEDFFIRINSIIYDYNRAEALYTHLYNFLDPNCKDQDTLSLIKYIAEEDRLEKILENPQVLKTPVVRNGKQSTIGYHPDEWKKWE